MKVVVTLGGNALLRRGEPMSAQAQRLNIDKAVRALVNVAQRHQLVLGHGNGPQVGLIALQNQAYSDHVPAFPFDVLGAESQAMVGYMFAQSMRNALGHNRVVNIVTQALVDKDDPAFHHPTKFIGPVYAEHEARILAQTHGWHVDQDGDYFRRVVPSPRPLAIVEFEAIKTLIDAGFTVIAGGGGGIPVYEENGQLHGVDAVIDKDYCCAWLASSLEADRLIIATDVDGVYKDWGKPSARHIKTASPETLLSMGFAAGSMGPKVIAACEFAQRPGVRAVIGSIESIQAMVEGHAGTTIELNAPTTYY